jgi:hypothetical protein
VEQFAQRQRLPFPVLIDSAGDALDYGGFKNAEGESGIPANVLLDGGHRIVFADVGFTEEKLVQLKTAVENVLQALPPK